MQEETDGAVTLDDDDPEILARVIEFLYTGDYSAQRPKDFEPLLKRHIKDSPVLIEAPSVWFTPLKSAPLGSQPSPAHPAGTPTAPSTGSRAPDNRSFSFSSTATPSGGRPFSTSAYNFDTIPSSKLAQVSAALTVHTTVYAYADRFDVANLRDLACQRFEKDFCEARPARARLAEIFNLVYESTRPNDLRLRLFVTKEAILGRETTSRDKTFCDVMRKHEPIAWALGIETAAQPANVYRF